jgi:hypothetical protein
MATQINKAKQLVKLLEKLVKKEHLYTKEKIIEMKAQLRVVKKEIADLEAKVSKGFGKK